MKELESIYNAATDKIVELSSNRTLIEKYLLTKDNEKNVSKMFVRDTKLSLSRLISFMIMPRGGSNQSEIESFYNGIGIEPPTKSAFTIKRSLISYRLFPYLNGELLDQFYRTNLAKRWKNKFIVAVDGTTLTMPRGARFESLYGYATVVQDKSLRVPTARVIVLTDVLNDKILTVELDKYGSYEAETAYHAIANLPTYIKDNAIFVFDRLFISHWFLTVLQNMDIQYVMRCRRNLSNAIDEFWDGNHSSRDIQLSLSRSAWSVKTRARYERAGITPDQTRPVFVHLTKSELPNGDNEVICSRIFGCKLSAAQAYALYGRRWRVETMIGIEKNEWKIELFSGYSRNAILQDIYCKIISFNLCSMAAKIANRKLKVNIHKKKSCLSNAKSGHCYQINLNMALYNLRLLFMQIVCHRIKMHVLLVRYIKEISRYYEPEADGRSNERNFRTYKTRGKYATFTNYASVI